MRNAVKAARSGFDLWSKKTGYERSQILYRLAEMFESRKEQFINELVLTSGTGKISSENEVNRSIDRIIWFAGMADKFVQLIGTVNPVQSGYFNFSIPEPMGVAGCILPEQPYLLPLISRMCAIVTSGNSCIVIASEKAPLPALSFAEVLATSDFPAGVVNILTGLKKEVIPPLASHMDVNVIDDADNDTKQSAEIQKSCSLNVKRYISSSMEEKSYYNNDKNENLDNILNFVEIKTIWHTMGV